MVRSVLFFVQCFGKDQFRRIGSNLVTVWIGNAVKMSELVSTSATGCSGVEVDSCVLFYFAFTSLSALGSSTKNLGSFHFISFHFISFHFAGLSA